MPFSSQSQTSSTSRARRLTFVAVLLAVCASSTALAQAWPQRPIKVVIPFPPGGPSDLVMRTAAEKILANLKQPIVIENQPGAGGNIGAATVARAAPDGYTFCSRPTRCSPSTRMCTNPCPSSSTT